MDSIDINSMIAQAPVMVFSKSYCPFCVKAKSLLNKNGIKFEAMELDEVANGSSIQGALAKKTSQTTVPNIFIGGKHVGGCDDLHSKMANGKISQMLKAAGVA